MCKFGNDRGMRWRGKLHIGTFPFTIIPLHIRSVGHAVPTAVSSRKCVGLPVEGAHTCESPAMFPSQQIIATEVSPGHKSCGTCCTTYASTFMWVKFRPPWLVGMKNEMFGSNVIPNRIRPFNTVHAGATGGLLLRMHQTSHQEMGH